jgi:hypothetical protein
MAWLLDKEVKRELPEQWKGIVPTEVFIKEAENLVEEAEKKDITLRIMGGLGIMMHARDFRDFAAKLARTGAGVVKGQEYTDIDFMSYGKQRNKIKEFFRVRGYAKRRATLSSAASNRQIYYQPKGWFYIDVFFDKLIVANHPIDFRGRLELDYPTVAVTDMLLEKIQMWEAFSAKDLKDCLLLFRAHDVEEKGEKKAIDSSYIARLLAKDWGFWYTATTNLNKLKKFILEMDKLGPEIKINPKKIEKRNREEIARKIEALLERVDKEPKSFVWKMRAKVGTKKRWYEHVERPETVGGFGIWDAILKE